MRGAGHIHASVQWKPPEEGWAKINTDGALQLHVRKGGVGLVARDFRGEVLGAVGAPLADFSDPLIVETVAMFMGLQWAARKGWKRVVFESDCAVLITALRNPSTKFHMEVGDILDSCALLFAQFDTLSFAHIKRQGNATADALARWVVHGVQTTEWGSTLPYRFRNLG